MIQIENIEKRFGPQLLFTGLSWHIRRSERIGLVGPNGVGKTTLLRILVGQEQADKGGVRQGRTLTVGYLPQEVMETADGTILEGALSGHKQVAELEHRMHELAERLSTGARQPEAEGWTEEYGHLQDRFATLGGYDLETRAKSILTGLGFAADGLERPVNEMSGGWQMRVSLARLLLLEPDLLVLDEPTNHLDLESLTWLEEFLRSRDGAYVVISHDRYFLNRMVDRIAEMENGRLTQFVGNYDGYVVEKERRFASVEATARRQAKEVERMTRFVDRFRYKSTKARQVQSRIKMLEKMERVEVPLRDRKTVRFRFPQPPRSGAMVIELNDLVKRYGPHTVYDGVDFRMRRGERMALIGPNGAGKTTLLKILAGILPHEGGQRQTGHNVTLAYYAQHTLDALHPENTVIGELRGDADNAMQPRIRGLLAAFLFEASDWDKKVSVLSGGEKARLALSRLLLRPANLLLLDEPTNHLDLRSRDVLEEALGEYSGTLCFISHDRYFINRIATSVCAVEDGRLEVLEGNYDDYRHWQAQERGTDTPPPAQKPAGQAAMKTPSPIREPQEKKPPVRRRTREVKRKEAETRQRFSLVMGPLRTRLEETEKKIAAEEQKLRAVEYELSSPDTYGNPQKAKSSARLQTELQERIATLTSRWEKLGEDLETEERRLQEEVDAIAQG